MCLTPGSKTPGRRLSVVLLRHVSAPGDVWKLDDKDVIERSGKEQDECGRNSSRKRAHDNLRGRRHHVVTGLCILLSLSQVDGQDNGWFSRWPQYADIVRRTVVTRAGLVADHPMRRQSGSDFVGTGGIAQ